MTDTLLTVAFLLLHGAALFAVLRSERRRPTATLAWLFAVIALPFVGTAFYLLFGRLPSRLLARRSERVALRTRAMLERYGVTEKLQRHDEATVSRRTADIVRLGSRLATTPASRGNQVDMLVNGPATYRSIISAIEAARDHIHVEFYIFQPDDTGRGLRDRLARRAGEGIEVRVVYDAMGCSALPDDFWKPLVDQGGQAHPFRPVTLFTRGRRADRVDFRNHRKIVVVDGLVGFTGGINVGREYLGLDEERGAWRDTHVRIEGPAVLSLQEAFAEDWLGVSGRPLDAERYFPEPSAQGTCLVQIIDSGPDRSWSPIAHVYVQALALARERAWLATPYFVPSEPFETALVTAALRGVDVRLLVPARGDSLLVDLASRSYHRVLLLAGVRIFEYERGFMHAKTLVVDEWMGTIGSTNIDMRSFHLNFELNAFIYDTVFAEDLARQYLDDLRGATEVQLDDPARRRWTARVPQAAARLLSPLL